MLNCPFSRILIAYNQRMNFFRLLTVAALLTLFTLTLTTPVLGAAQEASSSTISRSEGFFKIWESILRPVGYFKGAGFADVSENMAEHDVIEYARYRGLLDETANFNPGQPLTDIDAALWLYRVHNIAPVDEMTREDFDTMHNRYPLLSATEVAVPISAAQLNSMIADIKTKMKEETHEASFYSEDFHGLTTANGETFDMNAITAAHRTLPFNTLVKVTNLDNGKSVTVRINDRGPYADVEVRHMDLSLGAMLKLAKRSQGVLRNVTFERLGDADLYDPNAVEVEKVSQTETTSETLEASETSTTLSEATIWKQLFAKSMLPRRHELLDYLSMRRK
jgi:rare lipoprotein A (peptidoglycan hydrolase)